MSVLKRVRSYFFQETVEKSPRLRSVRFLKNSDPNEDTFRNFAASCLNILEDFATTTVAGIFARATSTEIENRTRTKVIDTVTYPNSVDPDQLPKVVAGDNVTVIPTLVGNCIEYEVSIPATGAVTTDGTMITGDGTSGDPITLGQQSAFDGQFLKWDDFNKIWVPKTYDTQYPLAEFPDTPTTIHVGLVEGVNDGEFYTWDDTGFGEWKVSGGSPSNGDFLSWNDSLKIWEPTTILYSDTGWVDFTTANVLFFTYAVAQQRTVGPLTSIRIQLAHTTNLIAGNVYKLGLLNQVPTVGASYDGQRIPIYQEASFIQNGVLQIAASSGTDTHGTSYGPGSLIFIPNISIATSVTPLDINGSFHSF